MSVRHIIIYPDPILATVAQPVTFPLSHRVTTLISDMAETMYDAPGVGLAAPQVGASLRIAITDTIWRNEENKKTDTRHLQVWINPVFTWKSEQTSIYEEGCLSVPETYEEVERPSAIRLRWQDEQGSTHESEFEGFMATALQHEFDHLDGRLFVDYLSPLKRRMIVKRMKKHFIE
ncbi:MAG: peptide deformylase [Mariprofundaceae bacterium]|nr:peptide deformylase [Mariprofundaceae bacterium]